MTKNRGFSLYDMEQFFKDAGAPRVNEKAVVSLEKELNDTVKELINEAQVYATYGRRKVIRRSDIALAKLGRRAPNRRLVHVKKRQMPARLLLRNRLVKAAATYQPMANA